MANLGDINTGAIGKDDPQVQIDSIVKQINDNNRKVTNEDRTRIIKDDSGTPRLLEGYQEGGFSNGNVGVKVSQVGIDVTSATSDQLISSTDFNSFKIVYSSPTITIPPSVTSASIVTIPHGLSYVPVVLAYVYNQFVTGLMTPTPALSVAAGGTVNSHIFAQVDTDNVYLTAQYPGATVSSGLTMKYYLLRETAI